MEQHDPHIFTHSTLEQVGGVPITVYTPDYLAQTFWVDHDGLWLEVVYSRQRAKWNDLPIAWYRQLDLIDQSFWAFAQYVLRKQLEELVESQQPLS